MREQGFPVTVADLDIVNPYFRTLDSEAVFREHGIKLICSQFANSNVDAPAMPKEVYNLIDSRSEYGVLDIGGDDRGALALGRYVPSITEENDYEMLLVNNTNLGPETTEEDVLSSMDYANEVSEVLGIPIKMTCCDEKLYEKLKDKVENLFPLSLQKLYYHLNS